MKCICFVLGLVFASLALAQDDGSLTGQVLDPSGAAVEKVKVVLRNEAQGTSFSADTDQGGFYRLPRIPPGVYGLSANAAGFRNVQRDAITVHVGDRLRIDLSLTVGQAADTVTIEATTPLLQTEDATMGQVINNQKILEMPLNGRSWLQLATLSAGTVSYPGVADLQTGNQQNIGMNLGGTRTSQANFILDGTDNTNFVSGGSVAFPPVDSLQEFKVETNNYTADTGRLGGAVVNATIKSGTNKFHGTAYDFLRNRALNARNFFANPLAAKPEFTRNQFGASLGGPVLPNRIFFFLNYEGNRQRQDQTITTQVFTDAQKAGNFSSQLGAVIGTDALGRSVNAGQIFDPLSVRRLPNGVAIRDPFPGNVIPVGRLNPISKRILDLVPGPNLTGSPNFAKSLSNPLNIDTYVGRVDLVQSASDTLFGHFNYSNQDGTTAPILGFPIDGNTGLLLLNENRQLGAGWTHVFSPSVLSELRIGYARNVRLTQPAQEDKNLNAEFGIPFPNPGPGLGGLAQLSIAGFTALGTQNGTFPQYMNKYEITEHVTVIKGRHTMKAGVQAQLKLFQNRNACNNCRGALAFNGNYTQQPGFSGTGSAVADFLTGVANTATLGNSRNVTALGRDLDLYAQDRWLVNSKLTVTAGLRFQYHPPSSAKQGLNTNAIFGPGSANLKVVVGPDLSDERFNFTKNVLLPFVPVVRAGDVGLDAGLVHNTSGQFAPRLGIAYQLGPKTVLRTG